MADFLDKVSLQVREQLPEFVQAENQNFVAFMKSYYEFLESAELVLTSLGSVDGILNELGTSSYILLEDTNIYRQGQKNKILLQDTTNGAFVQGETIKGSTSLATAIIRVDDINIGSRLFISTNNKFVIGETIIGQTSNATGVISSYTPNPVQSVSQLLEYSDVDDTIDSFFNQFKEAFLRTIPKKLASSSTGSNSYAINERNLLKNITDLYRSKGTKKGHELFFRILLKEDPILYYPQKDMIRVSAGNWAEATIIRVRQTNDTFLMEDSSTLNGDIFLLMEGGGQILDENSVDGDASLDGLVGQTVTQRAIIDDSILPGGPYYNKGFPIIGEASAQVDSVFSYNLGGEKITEFLVSKDSELGTFAVGHTITGIDNAVSDTTITAKIIGILSKYDAANSTSSQYLSTADALTISAANGNDGGAKIDSVTSGTISEIIVDDGGSGYAIGDTITVTNANTNGTNLAGQVSLVDGGIAPEAGDLLGEWEITLESGTAGGPGQIITENSELIISNRTQLFDIGETINGRTSKATGTVIINDTETVISYKVGTGVFVVNERIYGTKIVNGVVTETGATATITTVDTDVYIQQQGAYDMLATDHIILEPATVYSDGIPGNKIAQESGGNVGDVTDAIVTKIGYGYTALPRLALPTTGSRTGGTIYAKGVGVGKIRSVDVINVGAHYTTTKTGGQLGTVLNAPTAFLCTSITGTFIIGEGVVGQTSGAVGTFKETVADINVLKLSSITGTFEAGETITGDVSTKTAVIDSYTLSKGQLDVGTLVLASGRYIGEAGWLDESTQKIQDSYYYQLYSYVVRTGTSIAQWRDQLLASLHPAGWALFGQVDLATNVQRVANITSIIGLGPVLKVIFQTLFGRRLGTTDQGPLNPNPDVGINYPPYHSNVFELGSSAVTFVKGDIITGGTSTATGIVISDTTNDASKNLMTYLPTGSILFQLNETITASGGKSAVIRAMFGLEGRRDLTLNRHFKILKPPIYMTGTKYGFAPNYLDAEFWKFTDGMVSSAASSRTFGSMNVYPVYLNMLTTITSAINDSVVSIPVAATNNLPTQGTIKLEDEEITYTGRSTASGAGNLTGATRGANGTTAASHIISTDLTLVRLAASQSTASGFRLSDWATNWEGTSFTIADFVEPANDSTSWVGVRKNNISPPTEITMWKT